MVFEMNKKETMMWIFYPLFLVLIILQILDVITTTIAYEVGLGADELNPLAALLMSYNLLWLGKAVAIVAVGMLCYWLWKKDEMKLAIRGVFIGDCIYVCVIGINLFSLGMVV